MKASWTFAVAALAVAACTKQTPDMPASTAVVVPKAASAPFPAAPASDPSLPSASVVASQPDTAPPVAMPASSAGAAASAAFGAADATTSPTAAASAASQP